MVFCLDPPSIYTALIAIKTFILLKVIIHFVIINSVIIFKTKNQKTPSNGTCLGEPLGRFCVIVHFWCCGLHFFVVLFPGYLTMSLTLHPGFSGLWRPPSALSPALTFDCLFFFIYCERCSFEWAFFTYRCFPLCSFPTFLAQPTFLKASLGAGNYSL